MDTPTLIQLYIDQLSPSDKVAHAIAVKNLESSYDVEKSIGFIEFKQKFESNT